MKPAQLLGEARRLLDAGHDGASGGLRLRAATILARQSLEGRMDEILTSRVQAIAAVTFDARLLVLPAVMNEPELAAEIRYTWAALSSASHLHAYELPPTVDELSRWFDCIQRFLDASNRPCN